MSSARPVYPVFLLLCILLAGVLFSGCSRVEQPEHHPIPAGFSGLAVGDAAPPFVRSSLDGSDVEVGPGQPPTLLNLWATWCAPCIAEFPDLEKIHQELGPDGLRVLGLNVEEVDTQALAEFGRELGATFTLLVDPTAALQDEYRALAVPSTYLIGADGLIDRVWTGRLPENSQEEIAGLLAAARQ